ncbi:uncharacterized protein LOC121049600 isoform X4 [Rosa chinensis]|uniref:uncharacterized protein LOC121049600 isoform X4 n=1 Tax=Rosa chinensis TaxID=74649 RepID=UPI001AD8E2B3|nr:uncharacterized protein LOC121049600 isoform X4 [Rosa chinensis]
MFCLTMFKNQLTTRTTPKMSMYLSYYHWNLRSYSLVTCYILAKSRLLTTLGVPLFDFSDGGAVITKTKTKTNNLRSRTTPMTSSHRVHRPAKQFLKRLQTQLRSRTTPTTSSHRVHRPAKQFLKTLQVSARLFCSLSFSFGFLAKVLRVLFEEPAEKSDHSDDVEDFNVSNLL